MQLLGGWPVEHPITGWEGCWKLGEFSWKLHNFLGEQQVGWLAGKNAEFFEGDNDRHWMSSWHVCAISSVSRVGMFESRVHCMVKLSGWPTGGLLDFLARSADWNGLLRNACTILGDSRLSRFWDFTVQTTWEETSSSTQFWATIDDHWELKLCNAAQQMSSCWRMVRSTNLQQNYQVCERITSYMHDLVNTHSTWLDDKTPQTIKTTYT